ncbi:LCP family protein [Corynebacterium lizhenjunii]|uniref:LCP family protein n=1 Tax=Corynebacterium lizhenjunii TaxID=2709394 RepID=A0A7T0KF75_9CORY|nr:LCP family protein [Corynebacterium lizhenjunii]
MLPHGCIKVNTSIWKEADTVPNSPHQRRPRTSEPAAEQDFPRTRRVRDIQPAPTKARSLRQSGPTPLKVALAVASILVLLVSGTGYAFVGRLGGELGSVDNLTLGTGGADKGESADGALDILLVGSDSRTDAQGNTLSREELDALHAGVDDGEHNTDTIMVIRIPNDGSRASAVSIPRDTYVHDSEHGNMKINGVFSAHETAKITQLTEENEAAVARGESPVHTDKDIAEAGTAAGRAALLNQVRELSGVDIDHYAEVGLLGFVLLTDAVGGVNVCLNEAVDDEMSGARFPAGEQTLNGAQGLAFVRQRYGLPRGDLDRIVRQQSYMASLVAQVLNSGTLTNPSKLSKISRAIERSVVFDSDWDIMSIAQQLSGLAGGNVTFNTIPVTSIDGVGDYGESIVTIDPEEVHRFFEDLAKSQEQVDEEHVGEGQSAPAGSAPELDGVTLHVLNAGDTPGLAAGIGAWLTAQGYTVDRTANAEAGVYAQSQVVAASADNAQAQALAEALGGLPVTANPSLEEGTIIVVAAADYAGPADQDSADAAESADAPVGTPGGDFGAAEVSPEIDAGGDSPRCVN